MDIGPAVTRLRRRQCSEQCKSVGMPYLERFFAIKEMCTVNSKINYRHCFSTFMLSSRHEFECLDTVDRVKNFKTPMRNVTSEVMQSSSLGGTPTRRGVKRKNVDFGQDLKLDLWEDNVPMCKFCKMEFDLNSRKKGKFKSHLLYECTEVHNSQPLKRANIRGRPRGLYKRLAELAFPPNPGAS